MPTCRATASAVRRLSPVSMTIANAFAVQLGDRLRRALLDRIGDDDQPGELAVDRDEHHALALGAMLVRCPPRSAAGSMPRSAQQRGVAERDLPAVDAFR